MFIHLGEDVVIKANEVIAIFQYNLFQDERNRSFIQKVMENKTFIRIGGENIKSVILTGDCLYFSPFSPNTLKKRSEQTMT
ncbi:extracellular matrix regulator RemB [Tuberibacillus calidus]|jgi:hypothetical protein|uniref:extracellular matrix regulator RemB n=1 Tax=Tuberibacillus calidus TaxID=340097 RepID=UPI000426E8D3|nr:extracellular matrix/biofilm biosynthesis regulator RemA family protein [Tuberibacillus calidus]